MISYFSELNLDYVEQQISKIVIKKSNDDKMVLL